MSVVRSEERTPEQLSELLAILQAQGFGQASLGALMGEYLSLPGLVGFWPGSAMGSSGELRDLSGNALHLSRNGTANQSFTDFGTPFLTFDGSGDYFSLADTALLDILGTEVRIVSGKRGLTFGCFCRFTNSASAAEVLISKWATSNWSYNIRRNPTGNAVATITSDGTFATQIDATHTNTISAGQWVMICGRFVPSTSVDVYMNGVKVSNTSSIPTAIYNGTASLNFGATDGGSANELTGDIALPFLCAAAVPDDRILSLYHMGRRLFGA